MAAAVATAASSMTKRTEKKKRLKAVSQKKRLFRSNDSVLCVLMWGVNHSMNEMSRVKNPVMLMPDEFKAYTKIRIDNHMFNKDNMPSHFQFKELCPLVFRNLRERFGVDETIYWNALTKRCPKDVSSPGKSGARFLTSYDKRFVIKTISGDEVTKMNRILKDYHQYVVESHARTLLPQYFGLYRIRINEGDPVFFLVMRSVFSPRIPIHVKYDLKSIFAFDQQAQPRLLIKCKNALKLNKYKKFTNELTECVLRSKGSSVDRTASEKERSQANPTYKDNDFMSDRTDIKLEPEDRARLLATLESDTTFLASLNLMDYSLLLGIHDTRRGVVVAPRRSVADEGFDSEDNTVDDDDDDYVDDDDDAVGEATPPDSPRAWGAEPAGVSTAEMELDPNLDVFALNSSSQIDWREIYMMGLVDILTEFGVNKRTANLAKTVKHGAGAEISTVHPDQYARRFMDFITRIIK